MKRLRLIVILLGFAGFFGTVHAVSGPSVQLRLDKDLQRTATPTYTIGESFYINIKTNCTCYVYLYNVQASGSVIQLIPNPNYPDNLFTADQARRIPAEDAPYRFEIQGPAGYEEMIVIASPTPLDAPVTNSNDLLATTHIMRYAIDSVLFQVIARLPQTVSAAPAPMPSPGLGENSATAYVPYETYSYDRYNILHNDHSTVGVGQDRFQASELRLTPYPNSGFAPRYHLASVDANFQTQDTLPQISLHFRADFAQHGYQLVTTSEQFENDYYEARFSHANGDEAVMKIERAAPYHHLMITFPFQMQP